MTTPSSADKLALLRAVSRSFYVSIRLLPRPLREPVAAAYLLARATDTIADTAQLARSSAPVTNDHAEARPKTRSYRAAGADTSSVFSAWAISKI